MSAPGDERTPGESSSSASAEPAVSASATSPAPSPRAPSRGRTTRWLCVALALALCASLGWNVRQAWRIDDYFAHTAPPTERFRSGDRKASERIAVISVRGTIMPPFTERILRAIRRATDDERVRGVLLAIDSPGGLVADSHQIYHALQLLREEKPIYVSMKRMAASGGYYVAMGAGPSGRLFAEPTTWTGSIGVIIPRYDASALASKIGVESESLTTGPFKDTLNPFQEMTPEERELWNSILEDAFERFKDVISENRAPLDGPAVDELATGQIYTARQALEAGLVDEIGFEDDALEALQESLGLEQVRVVTYDFQPALWEVLLGSLTAHQEAQSWQRWLDLTVPKALYYCSWAPAVPTDPSAR